MNRQNKYPKLTLHIRHCEIQMYLVFEIDLKDEEIAGLDKNSKGPELSIVFFPRHRRPINSVLAAGGAGNGPRELKLRPICQLVNQANICPAALLVLLLVVEGIDQVLQLGPTEVARPYAEHEAYSVHEVGFTGSVGPNDRREVIEGADCLEALVGLEVLKLQPEDFALRDQGRHGWSN